MPLKVDSLIANTINVTEYLQNGIPVTFGGGGCTPITYAELTNLISSSALNCGSYYLITDYQTCYDRPNYDIYKGAIPVSNSSYIVEAVDSIMVLAVSVNRLALDAYQPNYPNDTIKYDVFYNTTESGNPAKGRITERVDEFGNRADYDHRTIQFKRYRLLTYDRFQSQQGTVELQAGGTVVGSGTNFTSLFAGQIIAIPGTSETFYEITTITDNFTMTVTGSAITPTPGGGYPLYLGNSHSYDSYYPNNVDGQLDFVLYKTFFDAIDDGGCYNTYIGDHAKYFTEEGFGDFLLANNVLKTGRYENNTIGDSSYNNTFNDDCTGNKIGYGFRNNITDDDFDSNLISDFFEDNIITANFQYNQIGRTFYNNIILCNSFNQNQIGTDFTSNVVDGQLGFSFINNQIGNNFNGNNIYNEFYQNVILNDTNSNSFWYSFYRNSLGNDFSNNNIYNEFYENEISHVFINNNISDYINVGSYSFRNNKIGANFDNNLIVGNFFSNTIANGFVSNAIQNNFAYNRIGSEFQGNAIDADFGFGGAQARGNVIGNLFNNNSIGEYFYDNTIGDNFGSNTIGDDFSNNKVDYGFQSNSIGFNFQNNDIKVDVFAANNFITNQGNVLGVNFDTPAGTDNVYTNVTPSSQVSAYGAGATFDITVSAGAVSSVAVNQVGTLYQVGDTFVILGSLFGGVDGVNLTLTVNSATVPYVNKTASCTIFRDEDGNPFLSYIDNTGTLQVTSVTA